MGSFGPQNTVKTLVVFTLPKGNVFEMGLGKGGVVAEGGETCGGERVLLWCWSNAKT